MVSITSYKGNNQNGCFLLQ